jgi:RNA polymerase sigma factor (sigma-70 family)
MDRIAAPSGAITAETFTALFATHAPRVRRQVLAGLRFGDAAQADDLVQDIFLALWRYMQRGDRIGNPAGLLTVMARRRVIDHYRLARVRREVPTDYSVSERKRDARAIRELVAA